MPLTDALYLLFRNLAAFAKQAWWLIALMTIPTLLDPICASLVGTADLPSDSADVLLLGWTVFSMAAVLILLFVQIRFHVLGNDLRSALKPDGYALRTFLPFAVAYLLSRFALALAAMETAWAFGPLAASLWSLVDLILAPLLALWAVSAPGGGKVISPITSVRTMAPHLVWSVALLIAASLPLLGVWALAILAVFGNPDLVGAFLLLERIIHFVAWPTIMFASMYIMAKRAGLQVTLATQ